MKKRTSWPIRAVWACLWCFALTSITEEAVAQESPRRPFVDGVTAGIGLSFYQGDLDENPFDDPVRFFTAGSLNMLLTFDRDLGPVIGEAGWHYSRFNIDREGVEMTQNVLSFEVGLSRRLNLIRPDLFRVFASAGPAVLAPQYDTFPPENETFKKLGTRVVGVLAVGVVLQDRVRLGMRITGTDYLDGTQGPQDNVDLISFVNVGYRFKLSR